MYIRIIRSFVRNNINYGTNFNHKNYVANLLLKTYIYQFRVAWKVRCQDDTDLQRYTKDCNLESEEIFPPKLFKGGNSVLKPSRRKEAKKLSDAS